MEMHFEQKEIRFLKPLLRQVQTGEQTQELRLTEDLPDVGRIIGSWGQVILRTKEWRGDSISCGGGIQCRVLYEPEDGSQVRVLESWMPFQLRWNLDDGLREGSIRLQCLLRGMDARSVSARKIMVRCGYAVMAQALREDTVQLPVPGEVPEDVQLLVNRYPLRLGKQVGEKSFTIGEELPVLSPEPERIVAYTMEPQIGDAKIHGDKLSFRGTAVLHLTYLTREGKLHSRDLEFPFSQFAALDDTYGPEALADVVLAVTGLELEGEPAAQMGLKGSLVAQYRIDDRQMLDLVEDAYSTARELEPIRDTVLLPAVLEQKQFPVNVSQTLRLNPREMADVVYWPDFPEMHKSREVNLTLPGVFQAIWYDENGKLQSTQARTEETWDSPCGDACVFEATVLPGSVPRANIGNGIQLSVDAQVSIRCCRDGGIGVVKGLELGAPLSDKGRPSLVLCRGNGRKLWDLARDNLATMAAIKEVNSLEGEPEENRMLLIPVAPGTVADS